MNLFYSFISSVVRIFNKKFPYFLCCASCGEIGKPLRGGMLCASLSFSAPISLLLSSPDLVTIERSLFFLNKHCSWLHNIIVVTEQYSSLASVRLSSRIPIEFFTIRKGVSNIFSYVRDFTSLCEHFILCSDISSFHYVLDPLDFFTPNGIPLCKLHKSNAENSAFGEYSPCKKNIALTKESIIFLRENNYHNLELKTSELDTALYSLFLHRHVVPVFCDT